MKQIISKSAFAALMVLIFLFSDITTIFAYANTSNNVNLSKNNFTPNEISFDFVDSSNQTENYSSFSSEEPVSTQSEQIFTDYYDKTIPIQLINNLNKYLPTKKPSRKKISSIYNSGAVTGYNGSMPSEGNVNVLVIMVEFQDEKFDAYYDEEIVRNMFFSDEDKTSGIYPYESLSAYYKRSSYGKLNINGEVFKCVLNEKKGDDYCIDKVLREYSDSIKAKCDGTDAEKDVFLNEYLKKFDSNNDGILDGVYFHYPGERGEWRSTWWSNVGFIQYEIGDFFTGSRCCLMDDGRTWTEKADSYSDRLVRQGVNINTAIHETGHMLGLTDYYDYEISPAKRKNPMQTFEMMSNNVGDHNGFSKMLLGWLDADNVQIITDNKHQTIKLRPYSSSGDIAIIIPNGESVDNLYTEFYMVEYYTSCGNDTLYELNNYNGLRIYHINAKLNSSQTAFMADNNYHDGLPLIQCVDKDGYEETHTTSYSTYTLSSIFTGIPWGGFKTGDYNCFYYEGDEFTPYTGPSSFFYADNTNIFQTGSFSGVNITDISLNNDYATFTGFVENSPSQTPQISYNIMETSAGDYSSNKFVKMKLNTDVWLSNDSDIISNSAYFEDNSGNRICDATISLGTSQAFYPIWTFFSSCIITASNSHLIDDDVYNIVIPAGTFSTSYGWKNDEIKVPFDDRKSVKISDTLSLDTVKQYTDWQIAIDNHGNGGEVLLTSDEAEHYTYNYQIIENYESKDIIRLLPNNSNIDGKDANLIQQMIDLDEDTFLIILMWSGFGENHNYVDLISFYKNNGAIKNERLLDFDGGYFFSGAVNGGYAVVNIENLYEIKDGIVIYDFNNPSKDKKIFISRDDFRAYNHNTVSHHPIGIKSIGDDFLIGTSYINYWTLLDSNGNVKLDSPSAQKIRDVLFLNNSYIVLCEDNDYIDGEYITENVVCIYDNNMEITDKYIVDEGYRTIKKSENGYFLYDYSTVAKFNNDFNLLYKLNRKAIRDYMSCTDNVDYIICEGNNPLIQKIENKTNIILDEDILLYSDTIHIENNSIYLDGKVSKKQFENYLFNSSSVSYSDESYGYILNDEKIIISTNYGKHSKYYNAVVNYTPVSDIKLDKDEVTLKVDESAPLEKSIYPNNATFQDVIWKSENSDIATVDEHGNITAVSPGTTRIFAQTIDGNFSDSCLCSVINYIKVDGIEISTKQIMLEIGKTTKLTYCIVPSYATNKLIHWSSSDNSIAEIDENGTISAKSIGEAIITAKTDDGDYTDFCSISVVPIDMHDDVVVEGIELDKNNISLAIGSVTEIKANVIPENSTHKNINWSTNAPDVAIVNDDGYVSAISEGTAIITATTENGLHQAWCVVSVYKVEISDIHFINKEFSIILGNNYSLYVEISPNNASTKDIIWSSSNPDVISVDENGFISALLIGKATIMARASYGSYDIYDTCEITVITDNDNNDSSTPNDPSSSNESSENIADDPRQSDNDKKKEEDDKKTEEQVSPQEEMKDIDDHTHLPNDDSANEENNKNIEEQIAPQEESINIIEVPEQVVIIDGVENPVNVEVTYQKAYTYTGSKITPKDLSVDVDRSSLESAVVIRKENSGIKASDLFSVSYASKNNKAASENKAYFYAKIKFNEKKAKKAGMTKAEIKSVKSAVKKLNNDLKKKKCYYTITPLDISEAANQVTVTAKLDKKGIIKLTKKQTLSGIKAVKVKTSAKTFKLSKKQYTIAIIDQATNTISVTGKGNFKGSVTVTVTK